MQGGVGVGGSKSSSDLDRQSLNGVSDHGRDIDREFLFEHFIGLRLGSVNEAGLIRMEELSNVDESSIDHVLDRWVGVGQR